MGVFGDAHIYIMSKSSECELLMIGSDRLRPIFGNELTNDSNDARI